MEQLKLKPIRKQRITLKIVGTSPLITHPWPEKAKREMLDKMQGKKTKTKGERDPHSDFLAATYFTKNGEYAIPAMAIKSAILTAAHKDIGIEKTLVRKALFLKCDNPEMLIPIICDEPTMREDCVRVGMGSADLRYRPQFDNWSATVVFDLDSELLQLQDLVTLIDRAGFGVGICEWRPEKGGEFGRFQIDPDFDIEVR